jgi:tetraacyldisaccharide 4'-kinase
VNPLVPLGFLYGAAAAVRARAYAARLLPSYRPRGPVISVGNLSVGGSGKTPMVEWIARTLRDAGRPVVILSRGYGGRYREAARLVSDGSGPGVDADLAGDEPVMLARALPGVAVVVGRRRAAAARLAERTFGPRVHVLDDGFQHHALRRDLDLLCATADDFRDRPLPAGRLREFPSAARRADGVLLAGEGEAPKGMAMWRVARRMLGCAGLDGRSQPTPRRPWLVSGIARPERFHADAAAACAEIAGRDAFPDHHRYAASEWQAVVARARGAGADALLTTAKDAVRLPPDATGLPVRVLRVGVEVAGAESLRDRVLAVAGRLP